MGALPEVDQPVVEGVLIPRHALDQATVRLIKAATNLLDAVENDPPHDKDSAMCLQATAKAVETAERIIRGLLAEQRERAKMAAGRPPMTDVEYQANVAQLAKHALEQASDEELLAILDERSSRRH